MANQHGKWKEEYTEIAKKYILSDREFTIEELMEHIPLTRLTIGKYLVKIARDMELVLKNATSKVPEVKVSIKRGIKPVVNDERLAKVTRRSKGVQRFMCEIKVPGDEEPMWMAISSPSKEDVPLMLAKMMGDSPRGYGIERILTSQEHAKTRVRTTVKSKGGGQRNDMAYFAGKYQPR